MFISMQMLQEFIVKINYPCTDVNLTEVSALSEIAI